ncbi:MAG: AAA family ATPase [Bacilli bacterium]
MLVGKICLTGGPCAGKTTALSAIEENLQEQGYNVLIVSESATELIKGGIRPFGKKSVDLLLFQNLIINYQLNKEKIYEEAANSLEGKTVIIYDRGVIDNKGYIGDKKFSQLLVQNNLNELTIMDNYDIVIHMVTAADGALRFYTLENNNARTETPEQARTVDKQISDAWVGHNNLKIIDNSVDFDNKIKKVINEINNFLGNPVTIRKQKKYLIDTSKSDLSFIEKEGCTKIDIEQTYFHCSNDNCERRLRKRVYRDDSTYYLTLQRKKEATNKIIVDKKITEKEYNRLLNYYDDKVTISKRRYAFIYHKQYFKLDIFEQDNLCVLEVEPTLENCNIDIPCELKVDKEISNNPHYRNYNLAFNKSNKQYNINCSNILNK